MAGTLLGSGYISLSVKYKGALDQIRSDLTRVENDSKKTSDVVKTHVERAVKDLSQGAKDTLAAYQKTQQEWVADVRKSQEAFRERNEASRAYFKEQIGSEENLRKLTKAHKEAQDEVTDSYKRGKELSKQYFNEIEKGSGDAARGMGRISKAFGADMGTMRALAPTIGAGIATALVAPIGFGIRGLKAVFRETFEAVGAIATTALRGAMVGGAAAITGAIGSAFYTGIKRLDTLAEVRLKFKFDKISNADAEQAISGMRLLANKVGVPFNELINQAEIFVAAGVGPGSDLTRVMEDAANVAGKTGLAMGSVSDTMLRFMQGNTQEASAVLQTWQQSGFNIIGGLATKLGTTNAAVIEMLQKGQVSWAMVQEQIQTQLSGYAEQSGQTIAAKLRMVWEKITDIGEAVLEPFFGSAVNGFQGIIDKLDAWALWLRDHQPEIVAFVGDVAQKFFDAGATVTGFAATVLDAFAAIVRAGGTLLDSLPGWLGGSAEGAQALWDASDAIKSAGDGLRESIPWWEGQAAAAGGYFETLRGATELVNAFSGATGTAMGDGKIQVEGTAEQITAATEKLDDLKIKYNTLEPGKIEILPDTEEAKILIDDFRAAQGLQPLYMDLYLRTHPAVDGGGNPGHGGYADRARRERMEGSDAASEEAIRQQEDAQDREWYSKLFGPFAEYIVDTYGRTMDGAGLRESLGIPAAPIKNEDGSFTDPRTGESWVNATQGGGTAPKPETLFGGGGSFGELVKGSPGQGFPISGYFEDPNAEPVLIPVDADPKPAKDTVKTFVDDVKSAEPTPSPLTADMERAEDKYKTFKDTVENNPLSIPLIASLSMAGGGMVGGIAPAGDRSGLKPQSIAALDAIQQRFPDATLNSGFRAHDPYEWHPDGRGLDIGVGTDMSSPAGKARGDEINAFILANKELLGVVGTLWQVQDHFDHIHVSMKNAMSPLMMGALDSSMLPMGGGGGGLRPMGGGMGGGGLSRSFGPAPRAPILPGVDDTDNPTGPKPLPGPFTPTRIPGQDPNYTRPDPDEKEKKEKQGPNYTGDYADPNNSYLPDVGGFFDPNFDSVMASPEVTPEEQARLQNALDKINDLNAKIAIGEQQLEELRNTKNVKPSQVMAKEQSLANLQRERDQAKTALTTLQDKVLEPAKSSAKGQAGAADTKGKGFWDQTLGEFVQSRMPDVAGLAGIATGGLKESFMHPEFSDPTQWGVTQAASGVMGFLSGIMPDPYSKAALGMGAGALGGDGSAMGNSLMSIIPYPFGTLGAPGSETEDSAVMPGLDASGNQVHMPAGSAPGQPIAPGPSGVVNNNNSVNVTGDTTAIEANTVAKAQQAQAPIVRAALPRS